jgi:GT2 family glycosyltransferase
MFTDLTIILVNWNLKDDTIECIESLLSAGATHSQIIVVDNGSTDDSIAALRNYFQKSIFIIETNRNLGYAAGVNVGIKYALSKNSKWLLLLNNDTIVAASFLNEMHKMIKNNQEYTILSPISFYNMVLG